MVSKNKLPVTVIILTFNEENNIEDCLKSVKDFAEEIFVVDSYSTDKTLTKIEKYTENVFRHSFENYSKQRNWALQNLPVKTEWILNLDADHRLTPKLKEELENLFSNPVSNDVKGFMISRRLIFMGRWIKHGGLYPTYHAVLFRKGFAFCEDRLYDQHFVIQGKSQVLKNDIVDVLTDSLQRFVERHSRWAVAESIEQLSEYEKMIQLKADILGNKMEQRRFMRERYGRLPIFCRSFAYFLYRYFIRLGFLDGIEGLIFHFLQGFWYRFLIDATIFEIKTKSKKENKSIESVIDAYRKLI